MDHPFTYSICVSAYNEADYLEACVESLLIAASHVDCEIFILDNGSTDGTTEILDKYSDAYNIRVEKFLNNTRLQLARNHLLKNCYGEIAIFLDADGQVDASYFEVLKKYKSAKYAIYSGPVREASSKQNLIFDIHYSSLMKSDPKFLIGANFAVNVDAALSVGGFENITYSRGDESPLIEKMKNNGHKHLFIESLLATNHFIADFKHFCSSTFYEGQNAYLCARYFNKSIYLKAIFKAMLLSGYTLIAMGIIFQSQLALFGILLIAIKTAVHHKYWVEVFKNLTEMLLTRFLKGLIMVIISQCSHEVGFWHSFLIKKKPNAWLNKNQLH